MLFRSGAHMALPRVVSAIWAPCPAPAGDRQLLAPPLTANIPAPHWAPPGSGPAPSVTRPWPRPAPSTLIGFFLQSFLSSDWSIPSPFRRSIGPLRPLSRGPAPRRGGVSRGARRGIGRRRRGGGPAPRAVPRQEREELLPPPQSPQLPQARSPQAPPPPGSPVPPPPSPAPAALPRAGPRARPLPRDR